MSSARKSCSHLLLVPDEETLAQGLTVGSTSAADDSMARRTLEHPQESSDAGRRDNSVLRRDATQNSCCASKEPRGLLTGSVLEMPTSVWISLRLEVTKDPPVIPQENAPHQGDVREVWFHSPMFGLPCHSNGNWVPGKPH